ncbi:MAG: hypothetical protein ACM3U2_20710, partial [Deltaproteobacteria bacterium]
DGACSFGCDETKKPAIVESPQWHVSAGTCEFVPAACFLWQQPDVFATAGRLQHPHEDFLAFRPQQQPAGPASFTSLPQHPRSPA